ncbi:MAG: DUF4878 domain-containing protein [Planctomycetota bacterium]
MKQLLTALMLVCSFALIGCGGGSAGPGDTVKEFAEAMEAGDTEKVKELAPAMGMAGEKLDGMVQTAAMEMKEKKGIKEIEIVEEKIDGETATVKAITHFGDGTKEEGEPMKLAKIDGKWVIDMGDEMSNKPGGGGNINLSDFEEDVEFPDDFEVPENVELPEGFEVPAE